MSKRSLKEMMGGMIGPMTAIAQAMSRNYDVAIQPSGFECCTDGKVIKFPFNADYLQEASRKVLHGILDHEVAHVAEEREHANAGIERPMAVMRRQPSNKHAMFLNVFEDIRIESKKAAEFPGVAENLAEANKHSVELFEKRHAGPAGMKRANFWHTLGSAIILKARGESIDWLPESYKPFLDAVADEIAASNYPTSRWVQDSERLAHSAIRKIEELAEELKEEQEKREQEKQEQEGEGEDSSEAGDKDDSKSDGGDESKGSAGDDDEDEGEDEGSAGGDDDGEGEDETEGDDAGEGEPKDGESGEGSEDGQSEGAPSPSDTDDEDGNESHTDGSESVGEKMSDEELSEAAKAAEKALQEDCDVADSLDRSKEQLMGDARTEAAANGRYVPHPAAQAADRETRPAGDIDDYNKALGLVKKQVSALRAKLLSVIRTRAAARTLVDREDGELDDGALYSARTGNRRLFTETVEGDKLDTAVSILVDLSGSMGDGWSRGHKAWYAKHMTIALAECFNALGVPFEVVGFHNDHAPMGYSDRGGYSRIEAFEYRVFKAFNEKFRNTRARFSQITGGANNADSEAVLWMAKRLAVRREARKILFVLSDGMPAHAGDSNKSRVHLREVIKMVTGAGIEVLGIGAECPEIKDYYNKKNGADYVIINNLDTLAVEVFKLMRARLLDQKRRAA